MPQQPRVDAKWQRTRLAEVQVAEPRVQMFAQRPQSKCTVTAQPIISMMMMIKKDYTMTDLRYSAELEDARVFALLHVGYAVRHQLQRI